MHRLSAGSRLGYTDRKSTRLNSSHLVISYAVFCLKKKKHYRQKIDTSDVLARLWLTAGQYFVVTAHREENIHPPHQLRNLKETLLFFFFFNDPATTEIYTLSLHDPLPIYQSSPSATGNPATVSAPPTAVPRRSSSGSRSEEHTLNSSHLVISYAVFCL